MARRPYPAAPFRPSLRLDPPTWGTASIVVGKKAKQFLSEPGRLRHVRGMA